MGWRFRKSIKILPGIRLNFGKKGPTSLSAGKGLLSANVSPKGIRNNLHVPGTGLSFQTSRAGFQGDGGGTRDNRGAWIAVLTVGGMLTVLIGMCVLFSSVSPVANVTKPKPQSLYTNYATPNPSATPIPFKTPTRKVKTLPPVSVLPTPAPQPSLQSSYPVYAAPSTSRGPNGPRQSPYITGPRGGCYYWNSHGNKTYVDHSYCN